MMYDFTAQWAQFWNDFGVGKKMVLSTSLNDHVTSRMMSVIQQKGVLYFQTDCTFQKYEQLIQNPNAALCIDNIQIEGICREIGHPLEHPDFSARYEEHFPGSFKQYSALTHERLFEVTPHRIKRWIYENGIPFVELFDAEKKIYRKDEYQGI